MPKTLVSVRLSQEQLDAVIGFLRVLQTQPGHRDADRADAIRVLIDMGLAADAKKGKR